tara:strand:- start:6015 stop:6674 length:660 start_codon:yes stop_codon:yes gene_type:complete
MISFIILLLYILYTYNTPLYFDFIIWKGLNKESHNYYNFSNILYKNAINKNIFLNITISDNYYLDNIKPNTILFGHSLGGYKCLNYNNSKLFSKIVYGATHNSYYKFKYLNKIEKDNIPTLTIIGNKDGIIPISFIADEILYNKKNNLINQTVTSTYNTNHLCICNNVEGKLSYVLGIKDNNLDYDVEIMLNTVSNKIIDYILSIKKFYDYDYIKHKNI